MKGDQRGQAILEFLVFLPLLLLFIGLVVGIGNAINGSINQQKASRGYFFYISQNNSMIPRPDHGSNSHMMWRSFGMFAIGWTETFQDDQPVAPCYRIPVPLNSGDNNCREAYSETTTQLIRVGSVFGVCGATYMNTGNHIFMAPFKDPSGGAGDAPSVSGPESCFITR